MYKKQDNYGTSYYYRGDVNNNYVQFGSYTDEVTFTVIERKIFRMEKNTILKIEAEEMPEQDGQYVGPYEENFDGIAYYANKDMTAAPVFFAPEEGTFIITLTGCADASTAANLSLYIDDEKVATYTWNSNTTKELSKEVRYCKITSLFAATSTLAGLFSLNRSFEICTLYALL